MTLARRLEKLEARLTPTQLVLRWLDEAHAHGSLEAYVAAILDDPPEDFPLNHLLREAREGARVGTRRPSGPVDAEVRTALERTAFRFELVLQINVRAQEVLDRQVLVHGAVTAWLILLSEASSVERAGTLVPGGLATARDLAVGRVVELHAEQQARAIAEARYLAGHPALFPVFRDRWAAHVNEAERLAVLADRLAELDGLGAADLDDRQAAGARAQVFLADVVEPAKATALEKLGEGPRATRIATNWLRGSLGGPSGRLGSPADLTREGAG